MDKLLRLSKSCLGEAERQAVARVLETEYLGMGQEVGLFEEELATYIGRDRDVICVCTGTAALQLALQAAGIGPGDEVLAPTLTFIASFQAISATGATAVACDTDRETGFISLEDMKRKLTGNTRAVMPVHYASHAPELDRVYEFAMKHGLRVVEDACHAFGSIRDGERIGARGDLVCFSFDGIKNITSGEGGAVVTSDREAAVRIRDARLLGVEKDTEMRLAGRRSWDFEVRAQGWRYHMSNIMAAIGREQLRRIDSFQAVRHEVWKTYEAGLDSQDYAQLMFAFDASIHPHIIPIRVSGGYRDALRQHLIDQRIECGIHYKPNHLLERYAATGCTNAQELYAELLTLPCHADMTRTDADRVVDQIRAFFS